MPTEKDRATLKNLLGSQLDPFLSHIRFPYFKNLAPDTRINFTYPIVALVGANGTNKSSILRALQGAPGQSNLGNYWFSTITDPIDEANGNRHCFIYGYKHKTANKVVEVLKARIRKQSNPDYWEPSRPIKNYNMEQFTACKGNKSRTRWDPIQKSCVYIDFRAISAFDKYFYYAETKNAGTLTQRKDFIRKRAPYLSKAINRKMSTYPLYKNDRIIGVNRSLTREEVEAVSNILAHKYQEIHWIGHSFFNCDAYTCVMKTNALSYTEAFAGSGEFAAVRLVVDIMGAEERSLILLDEPEVSLHPGAQERLVEFLFREIKKHKHQIIMSTHSPAIIRGLPPEAIKVLVKDSVSNKVKLPTQESAPEEAFFHIGEPVPEKITIVVEDELAKRIVSRAIMLDQSRAFFELFEIKYFPGGSQTLWAHYLPIFAAEKRNDILVLLDGDQKPTSPLLDPATVPDGKEDQLKASLFEVSNVDVKFYLDGGASGGDKEQRKEVMRAFIDWAKKHVSYLPGLASPEEFIWNHMDKESDKNVPLVQEELPYKAKFEQLSRFELGMPDVGSVDILQTQLRKLATIPLKNEGLVELYNLIKSFASTREAT